MIAPPLLVSFPTIDDYISSLPEFLKSNHEEELRSLHSKGLPPVVTSSSLALLFGYSNKFVISLRTNPENYYREFTIRKRTKRRKIQAPKVALKVIQKWFGTHLAEAITVDENVYGFVSGRSFKDAAKKHCGARWVYSFDIVDFFSSTPAQYVFEALSNLGYSEDVCGLLVALCCYRGFLAQGAPSSPVLSNLVMGKVDGELSKIADQYGLNYTRYADDIVFSGSGELPEGLVSNVRELFESTPWKLSTEKEYFADSAQGKRLKVHGLLVNDDKPKLTKGYRNKIRAYKHLLEHGKVRDKDLDRLIGHVRYAESIDSSED